MIKVQNVSKSYKIGNEEFWALRDINIEVESGKIAVILGPSGSGKSTLMNLIGGIDKPTTGEIIMKKISLNNITIKSLTKFRRKYVGYVFQFYNLIADLTVKENILVGANLVDKSMDINFILEKIGLSEHKDKFPKQLSGGQQQRVAIGRAIIKRPSILLCDEPTGALDYESSIQILELMQEINRDLKTTIIIITHNTALEAIANNIITITSGRIKSIEYNDMPQDANTIQW